jgi:hypothetical protein
VGWSCSQISVPGGRWVDRDELVDVVTPDGRSFETTAHFSLAHFNFPDPKVSIDRRWRVTILFPDKSGEDVIPGSKIFVSHETRNFLFSNVVAQ